MVKDPDKNLHPPVNVGMHKRNQLVSEKAAESGGKTAKASTAKKKKQDEDSIYFQRV